MSSYSRFIKLNDFKCNKNKQQSCRKDNYVLLSEWWEILDESIPHEGLWMELAFRWTILLFKHPFTPCWVLKPVNMIAYVARLAMDHAESK